jgi:16S rRNA (adenine1518-N6/adenine1519-N6)-dimethyltransferase
MQTLAQIRELLDSHGLAPKKSLGQNFLIDHNLIRKLVDASGVGAGDLVLEVGPGTGTLTEELLSRGCEVVACELDTGLAAMNRERLGAHPEYGPRFTLIEGDCLESKREVSREAKRVLGGRPFTLVANLPYGAATPLMLTLLIEHPECRSMHVTIQREVADRLLARAGDDAYGQISVVAAAAAEVRLIATLSRECFWPRPDVTSAMISLIRRERPLAEDLGSLAAFAQRVFGQRRKQLGGLLGREIAWPPGVEPTMRAEELDVERMVALWRVSGNAE